MMIMIYHCYDNYIILKTLHIIYPMMMTMMMTMMVMSLMMMMMMVMMMMMMMVMMLIQMVTMLRYVEKASLCGHGLLLQNHCP